MSKITQGMRNRPVITIFLGLAIVVGLPLLSAVGAVWYSQQNLIDYQVRTKVEQCENSNNSRSALLTVLDRVGDPPDSGVEAVSLTTGPEYEALPPEVQAYLRWLEVQIASQPNGSENIREIAADLRKTNPPDIDCEEVGQTLREELEAGWF